MTTGVKWLLHKQYIFTNSVSNCFGLGPVQIPKIFFFLNYSIKCQHTHILTCSSYDLIRNMMLTLVCQSRPTGAAHLVRKKTQRGFIFLESYQKGAAKANSNEPYWSFFLHHFKRLLNEEKSQTCIPSYRGKQTEARRGSNCLKSI